MRRTGIVDALERAIRHVRAGGLIVDARPDPSRAPRLLERGRVVGTVTSREEVALDDAAADRAIARARERGVLRSLDRGRLWHTTSFADAAELREYLRGSPRYAGLAPGTWPRVPRTGTLAIRRAVKYEVLALT